MQFTFNGVVQILAYFAILVVLTKPMGVWLAAVFEGRDTRLTRILGWLERLIYRVLGIHPEDEQPWTQYTLAMLAFSLAGLLLTYFLLRMQGFLPLNPQGFGAKEMPPHLAFNTAASFSTNTNWQSYGGETTLSYFSNMVALAIHNWMSAAVGLAVAVALIRAFSRQSLSGIGNFWVDVTRATVYVLLPLSFVAALVFASQGVPQNFLPYQSITTLEGKSQLIAMGPVASQEAIKQLGTNGGGFFNANSAHPYENPTPFTDIFTKILIFLIPAGLTYTFGQMVGNVKQGWALFGAMSVLFLAGAFACLGFEQAGNPQLAQAGILGPNMEGKETRFGIAGSTLFAAVTTGASCGAVNSMHDSFTPLGGLVPLFNIMTGEVVFGGVGAGLYGMLVYAILAVFIGGLMVGRTPEYLGKRIERFEVQMAMLAILVVAACILGFTAMTSSGPLPDSVNKGGPHGFSEILYSYTSAAGNNGSAFAGITTNTPTYNFSLGMAMLIGRFLMIIPILALAGSIGRKLPVPATSGTFPTDNGTFVVLLVGVVVIVGALTFIPALALGPVVEHFQMYGAHAR